MDSLKSRILNGDQEAFKEWMELHIQSIERLGMQFGLTPNDAGKMTETVFGNLYMDLNHIREEQLKENVLFKTAFQLLERFQVHASETGLFSFEEDNELHARIIDLPMEERIALILHSLHEMSQVDIAWIMDTTLENVEKLLYKAQAKLDGSDIEKQLEFLNKSFHRLRPFYNEMNIFYSASKKKLPLDKSVKKASRRKKPLILWLVGSIMLVLILSVTVIRSEAYQQTTDARYLENLNNSFQQELDKRFELIGLSEPYKVNEGYTIIFQGYKQDVSPETYGLDTKYKFKKLIRDLENQMNEGRRINKKEVKRIYGELVLELRLPSDLVEHLQKDPLTDNREQSLVFLDELVRKNGFLANAYYEILSENEEMILTSDLFSDGMVDTDKLLEQKSLFPLDLQNAIDGMATQYYSLTSIKDISPIATKYGTPELGDILHKNLHPDMQIYISLLLGDFNITYTGTFEEHLEALLELEDALPKTKESDQLIYSFINNYILLFLTAAGFNDEKGIFDASGIVRDEIRYKWRRLASNGEGSPSGQIAMQLIDEMEKSNWKLSPYYEQLIEYGIWGELNKKMKAIRVR